MNEWFVSNLQEALGSTVHDVQMILDYLSRRGDLETDHVGIFGEGSGGAIAVLAAAADPRIKAIDLLDPWGDWPDWMADSQMITHDERSAYLSAKYLDTVAPLDPVKWLPRLNIPVRIQYLQQNSTTPQKAQERLLSAAPKQAVKPPREQALEEYRNTGGKVFLDWIKGQIRQ